MYPPEEARAASAAVLAVGVYLGHPLDWDYLATTPEWSSLVQREYAISSKQLAEAARALPGGDNYIKAAKDAVGFAKSSDRAHLKQRDIVQEAVAECVRWAEFEGVETRSYHAVIHGAQRLAQEKKRAPVIKKKKPTLGAFYLE